MDARLALCATRICDPNVSPQYLKLSRVTRPRVVFLEVEEVGVEDASHKFYKMERKKYYSRYMIRHRVV